MATLREFILDQSTLATGNTVRDHIQSPGSGGGTIIRTFYPVIGYIGEDMQRVTEFDITIYKGDDFEQVFQMQNLDGTDFNLTSWSAEAEIREKKLRTSTLIIAFTVEIPSPTSGLVYLKLTDVQTTDFTQKAGFYDVLFTDDTGLKKTLIYGDVIISPTVTLPAP